MPFYIISLFYRITIRNKNLTVVSSSWLFWKMLNIFSKILPLGFLSVLVGYRKGYAIGGDALFIFSLLLGKTVLNNTFAGSWFKWVEGQFTISENVTRDRVYCYLHSAWCKAAVSSGNRHREMPNSFVQASSFHKNIFMQCFPTILSLPLTF